MDIEIFQKLVDENPEVSYRYSYKGKNLNIEVCNEYPTNLTLLAVYCRLTLVLVPMCSYMSC